MCVRYTLHKLEAVLAAIAEALAAELEPPPDAGPRYNVALTQRAPVVALVRGRPKLGLMRWGYAAEAKGSLPARLMPNAKSETVARLGLFRESAARRRCLVPANGFYEWRAEGRVKQPHLFTLAGERPFALAGIWREAGGAPPGYCVLTTEPNALMRTIHHRMPVILTGPALAAWLSPGPLPPEALADLTRPYEPEAMTVRPVSRHVSHAANEGPECLAPPKEGRTGDLSLDFGAA